MFVSSLVTHISEGLYARTQFGLSGESCFKELYESCPSTKHSETALELAKESTEATPGLTRKSQGQEQAAFVVQRMFTFN